MKKQFRKILLGVILSVMIMAVLFYLFFFLNPFGILDNNRLKWIPILIAGISIYFSAKINRETSIKFLPLLLIPIILFKPFNYFYFPFLIPLIIIGISMILVTHKNVPSNYRLSGWITSIAVLLYFLFTQPLVIGNKNLSYDETGKQLGTFTLWNFSDDKDLMLPDHQLKDEDNKTFNLINLKGKTHFITFWATWCSPCMKEKPDIKALKEKYGNVSDLEFIDISFDDDRKQWKKGLKRYNPSGLQLISTNQQETSRALDFQGIPMHLIVNSDGTFKKYKSLGAAKAALAYTYPPVKSEVSIDTNTKDKLDEFFEMAEKRGHMGSISLHKNGAEIYVKTMGYSDWSTKRKANNNTKYRIGSITKTFTAVIVMQLIEQGKLSLGDNLKKFFPEIPNANIITIEHLLKHRSGLFDITKTKDFEKWMVKPQTQKQMIDRIIKAGIVFNANEQREYSNSNYILLSYIIEKIENKSYADAVTSHIIDPCGLKNTYYGGIINTSNNEACSYIMKDDWQSVPETNMSIPMGAGGIVSSPTDLNLFYHQLFNGDLVAKNSLNKMINISDGGGIGLSQLPFPGKQAFGHPGSIDGFSSISIYFPKEQLALSYISNGEIIPLRKLVFMVLKIYFGKTPELPNSNTDSHR